MWIHWLLRPYCSREKLLSILYRTKICAILACFAYLVAIATLFALWKIMIAYLNSPTPIPYYICRNWHYTAYKTEICAVLAFLCKFGCYGNSLCFPRIFVSTFKFSDPENPTIHANIVSLPRKGTRIHRNTSYEPLTTFLRRTMRTVQVSKNVKSKKRKVNNRHRGWQFHLYGDAPSLSVQ